MPYVPKEWSDGPAGGTPITAAVRVRMEGQLAAAMGDVAAGVGADLTELEATVAGGRATSPTSRPSPRQVDRPKARTVGHACGAGGRVAIPRRPWPGRAAAYAAQSQGVFGDLQDGLPTAGNAASVIAKMFAAPTWSTSIGTIVTWRTGDLHHAPAKSMARSAAAKTAAGPSARNCTYDDPDSVTYSSRSGITDCASDVHVPRAGDRRAPMPTILRVGPQDARHSACE